MPSHPLVHDEALRRRLVKLARHWLGRESEAEDLVQDAYLRTTEGALPADGQEAWLVTVLRNLCIDHWRRQGRYEDVLEQIAEEFMAELDNDLPGHAAMQAQDVEQALLHLIRALPAGDVATVLLFEVFEFTHAELGDLAGCSEAASRQRFRRLLQRLRATKPEEGPHDEDLTSLFALCQQAMVYRDPAGLVAVLRATQPQVMLTSTHATQPAPPDVAEQPRAQLVQRGDQFALLIQTGNGAMVCLPLGETVEA